jgi:hypothetical protein
MTKHPVQEVERRAAQLLHRLGDKADANATPEYRDLLNLIRDLDPRFAFDLEGRPAALDAVRNALPMMERELFDAIVEDFACELAAAEEAIRQVARASGWRSG